MFTTTIHPRVSETDAVGHINNTTVPVWFEAGRNEIFKMFMPHLSFEDWKLIVVNITVDFVNQIYFGTEVQVFTWVKKIGNTSLVLYEELHQNDKLCAKGMVTYVNFDNETQKSVSIPPHTRQKLEAHMWDKEKIVMEG